MSERWLGANRLAFAQCVSTDEQEMLFIGVERA